MFRSNWVHPRQSWILDSTLWIADSCSSVQRGFQIQIVAGFRIPWAEFRIPKREIPNSISKRCPGSVILITLQGARYCIGVNGETIIWLLELTAKKQKHFIWVSRYLARDYWLRDTILTIFTSPTGDGTTIYVFIRATRRSSRLECKWSTLISQLFQDPK